uniref:Uncharacterized protein n=1 Tax=Parascaris univalens TaxID=6257 RepID=A0A915A4Y0_PARUN
MCCCCCCPNIHRHQVHLISYGCVSFCLITTGLVFTVFAIFQKDSQIGKVWLAGPTTMVVGLVLCGKVVIDWGPAMAHAREGSFDSRLSQGLLPEARMSSTLLEGHFFKNPILYEGNIENDGVTKVNGDVSRCRSFRRPNWNCPATADVVFTHKDSARHSENSMIMRAVPNASESALRTGRRCVENLTRKPRAEMLMMATTAIRCECDPFLGTKRVVSQSSDPLYGSINANQAASLSSADGSGSSGNPYQGETFVLNDRNYLI